jgi:Tol biopolymer transport system component
MPTAVPRRAAVLLAASLLLLLAAGSLGGDRTDRVSVSTAGAQADDDSDWPALSASGRWVAFGSYATNLAAGDADMHHDVFLHDRKTGATTLVSAGLGGAGASGASFEPALSKSGRIVAFDSQASNLVEGDGNGDADVFVLDRKTGTLERVSVGAQGEEGDGLSVTASLSASGRWVAFYSEAGNLVADDGNGARDVFVRDRKLGLIERASVALDGGDANGDSDWPSISANGRWVAFESDATNLVPDDDNLKFDIFVRDRKAGTTQRVSVSSTGAQAIGHSTLPALSANGRWVAFESAASNLVEGDLNGKQDVFVHDRLTGVTALASVSSAGAQANASCVLPAVSGSGRWIAWDSISTNLVEDDGNGDGDVFVHDRVTGSTVRASLDSSGAEGDRVSFLAALSLSGRYVAFVSEAGNLVAGDDNLADDVFVRDLK